MTMNKKWTEDFLGVFGDEEWLSSADIVARLGKSELDDITHHVICRRSQSSVAMIAIIGGPCSH